MTHHDVITERSSRFSDFRHQRDRIDNILLKLLERSAEWLDSNISFFNIGGLLSGAKLRTQFEKDGKKEKKTEKSNTERKGKGSRIAKEESKN